MFNKGYIEELYKEYMNVEVDDTQGVEKLAGELDAFKKILLLAPGASIKNRKEELKSLAKDKDTCVISVCLGWLFGNWPIVVNCQEW